MTSKKIDQQLLMELLSYDRDTGAFTWKSSGQNAGCIDQLGYRRITIRGRSYLAHRLAWLYVYGDWPEQMIDHIDGHRSNNAINNLRDVNRNINGQNQKKAQKHNSLLILGVTRRKNAVRNPYQVMIRVNGKAKYIGVFASAEEAGLAYIQAKRQMHEGCTI